MEREEIIIDRLQAAYPNAGCELEYSNVFELLVAVILSAQCTDKRVNAVTKELFKTYKTPRDFAFCNSEELEGAIYSCGFYKNKAKSLISASCDIVNRFEGRVPDNMEDLMSLRGVGKKTAAVVYSEGFNGQALAVDTHIFRVARRLGLTSCDTPLRVQDDLNEKLKRFDLSSLHHYLIFFGRYTCKSQRPLCNECVVREFCVLGE